MFAVRGVFGLVVHAQKKRGRPFQAQTVSKLRVHKEKPPPLLLPPPGGCVHTFRLLWPELERLGVRSVL